VLSKEEQRQAVSAMAEKTKSHEANALKQIEKSK
jgi:hypothetical protein